MTQAQKIKRYEAVLGSMACWEDGNDFARLDEPSSARQAREVLRETGAAKPEVEAPGA